MFNQEPLNGVYSGITPCANNQMTMDELKWPARLSQTRISRSGGSGRCGTCPNQVAHCACGSELVVVGLSGRSARTCKQFRLQPGVQDHVRRVGHALRTHLAGGGPKQGQEFGRATADVLMRLATRLALGLPGLARLRNSLVRACFILTPHGNTYAFSDVVGEFDEPLFTSVCGSTTVTTPALRLRCAVPVGHQVRVRWYELPASCSTRRMVLVPTLRKASRRKVRCNVLSDHVAVPSVAGPVVAARWPRSVRGRWLHTLVVVRGRAQCGRPPAHAG